MKTQEKSYNYIFAGGGCAALSLAFYMNRAGLLQNKTALIVDREVKNSNNRTWAYWTKETTAFDSIVFNKWDTIEFVSQYYKKDIDLHPYSYQVIRGIDFYAFVLNELRQNPNIEFLQADITNIENSEKGKAQLLTQDAIFDANWIFDSRFDVQKAEADNKDAIHLKQHFKGWVIEVKTDTNEPVFDTNKVRLFDFRTDQNGVMRFFYIIPHSATRALVEYTLFSEKLLEQSEYDSALKTYIGRELGIDKYEIVEEEMGLIPMSNMVLPTNNGTNTVYIGTQGGCSKPSTGYTFLRIQEQAKTIVEALKKTGNPVVVESALKKNNKNSSRHRLYDEMMLKVLQDRGDLSERVFSDLFEKNPIERLLRFLDEESSLIEDIKVMNSVAPLPFIKAFFRLKF